MCGEENSSELEISRQYPSTIGGLLTTVIPVPGLQYRIVIGYGTQNSWKKDERDTQVLCGTIDDDSNGILIVKSLFFRIIL